ncbi:MAG: HypC/HybG/HupF family hydrogenase formation chaperone [Sulfurihydrogenibium sp.]|jgi:hydrogenase expression/formation protein HypC|nr:HypC/HybG/HupF family hydrogenase formation chaperone [Sulfurihydrogenibium sp.]
MCLAIPSKIVEILDNNIAIVDTMGVRRKASLELLNPKPKVGDYVLLHVGFAIEVLSEEDALESLKLFEEALQYEDELKQ